MPASFRAQRLRGDVVARAASYRTAAAGRCQKRRRWDNDQRRSPGRRLKPRDKARSTSQVEWRFAARGHENHPDADWVRWDENRSGNRTGKCVAVQKTIVLSRDSSHQTYRCCHNSRFPTAWLLVSNSIARPHIGRIPEQQRCSVVAPPA